MKTFYHRFFSTAFFSITSFCALQGANLSTPLLINQSPPHYATLQSAPIDETYEKKREEEEESIMSTWKKKKHPTIEAFCKDTQELFIRCELAPGTLTVGENKPINLGKRALHLKGERNFSIFESLAQPQKLFFANGFSLAKEEVSQLIAWLSTWQEKLLLVTQIKSKVSVKPLYIKKLCFQVLHITPFLPCKKTRRPFYHGYGMVIDYQSSANKNLQGNLHLFSIAKYFLYIDKSMLEISYNGPHGKKNEKTKSECSYTSLEMIILNYRLPFFANLFYHKVNNEKKSTTFDLQYPHLFLDRSILYVNKKKLKSFFFWRYDKKFQKHPLDLTFQVYNYLKKKNIYIAASFSMTENPFVLETRDALYEPEVFLVRGFCRDFLPKENSTIFFEILAYQFSYQSLLTFNFLPDLYPVDHPYILLARTMIKEISKTTLPKNDSFHQLLLQLTAIPFLPFHDEEITHYKYVKFLFDFKAMGGSPNLLLQALQKQHPRFYMLKKWASLYTQIKKEKEAL